MNAVVVDRVELVYREHHERLWRALLSYCGDRDIASDAEAEAFSQALRRGDDIVDVGAWVWKASFRIAAGMLATRRSLSRSPVDEDPRAELPEATVEFLAMLGELSAQQRACIVLRYIGLYTPAEIGGLLETSPGAVRVQLHRAHAALRQQQIADRPSRSET